MRCRIPQNTHLAIEPLERRELLSVGVANPFPPAALGLAAVTADDFGNTFARATLVALSSDGSGSKAGKIEVAGDVDMFRIVAPVSGKMTIREVAATGSKLDPYLYVYSASQTLLAKNDDSGGTINSQVQINVVAGTAYYVKATGYVTTTGAYSVLFSMPAATDDYGNTFAQATTVTLSSGGAGTRSGRIEVSGDVDMFKFVAPVSGQMTIREVAATGSTLDPYLYVYNAGQQLLGQNDDSGGTVNSQVQISVAAGTLYYVKASGYPGSKGDYSLQFSTVSGPTSNFQIEVIMSGFTPSQQIIIQQAADRWEQVVLGDIPDVVYQGQVIDDLRIYMSAAAIDGDGGILGWSSVDAVRNGSYLPYLSTIEYDSADMASMETDGMLLPVVIHEMGHSLGIGVIWDALGLLTGADTSDPRFTGPQAVAEYNAIFGTSATGVPVEAEGGSGTALGHWDEAVLYNELMTGYINWGQTNPLSRITVASLADIGYQVNLAAADPYTRPSGVRTAASAASVSSPSVRATFAVFDNTPWRSRQSERLRAIDLVYQLPPA